MAFHDVVHGPVAGGFGFRGVALSLSAMGGWRSRDRAGQDERPWILNDVVMAEWRGTPGRGGAQLLRMYRRWFWGIG